MNIYMREIYLLLIVIGHLGRTWRETEKLWESGFTGSACGCATLLLLFLLLLHLQDEHSDLASEMVLSSFSSYFPSPPPPPPPHFNDERCGLASEMFFLQAPAFFLWQWLPLRTGFTEAWSRLNRILTTNPWVHIVENSRTDSNEICSF